MGHNPNTEEAPENTKECIDAEEAIRMAFLGHELEQFWHECAWCRGTNGI